jgi:hypothetical protein
MALHYSLKNIGLAMSMVLDDSKHAWWEEALGRTIGRKRSMGEIMDDGALVRAYLLDLADEARGLYDAVQEP